MPPLFQLAAQPAPGRSNAQCKPSDYARARAGGSYDEASYANLASTVLLFQFAGRTFLYTADSRGVVQEQFPIPLNAPPGVYPLALVSRTLGRYARADFEVTP